MRSHGAYRRPGIRAERARSTGQRYLQVQLLAGALGERPCYWAGLETGRFSLRAFFRALEPRCCPLLPIQIAHPPRSVSSR